jgi:hypothetical protein
MAKCLHKESVHPSESPERSELRSDSALELGVRRRRNSPAVPSQMGHNERTLFREHIKARLGSFLFVGVGKEERKARQVVALCRIPDPASLHVSSRDFPPPPHCSHRAFFPLSRSLAELQFAYAIFDFLSMYDRAVANACACANLPRVS